MVASRPSTYDVSIARMERPDLDAFREFLETRSDTLAEYDMNLYEQPSDTVDGDRQEWVARQLAQARRDMGEMADVPMLD